MFWAVFFACVLRMNEFIVFYSESSFYNPDGKYIMAVDIDWFKRNQEQQNRILKAVELRVEKKEKTFHNSSVNLKSVL
jgi:hypothetical protein